VKNELLTPDMAEERVWIAEAVHARWQAESRSRYLAEESSAKVLHQYATTLPDLLQTRAYAREAIAADPESPSVEAWIDLRVAERVDRQDVLFREPAPEVRVILDESALRRPTADPKVWRDQLCHLTSCVDLNLVVLQVLPLRAGLHGLPDGALTLLWQGHGGALAWQETRVGGELTEDPEKFLRLRLAFERVRDLALTPGASKELIERLARAAEEAAR
jgi:uncharacterized protein DUF5753